MYGTTVKTVKIYIVIFKRRVFQSKISPSGVLLHYSNYTTVYLRITALKTTILSS